MKRSAVVESVNGKRAVVSFLREEACGNCSGRRFCSGAKKTEIQVINDIGAEVGDTVEIETETSALLLYAAVLFLAPVLLALLMYLIFMGINQTLSYILAAVGFVLPYIVAAVLNSKRRDSLPVVKAILFRGEGEDRVTGCFK